MGNLLGALLRAHEEGEGEKRFFHPLAPSSTLLVRWECLYAPTLPPMWNYMDTGKRVSSQILIYGGDLENFTFWPKKWISFSDDMQLRMTRLWLPELAKHARRLVDEEK